MDINEQKTMGEAAPAANKVEGPARDEAQITAAPTDANKEAPRPPQPGDITTGILRVSMETLSRTLTSTETKAAMAKAPESQRKKVKAWGRNTVGLTITGRVGSGEIAAKGAAPVHLTIRVEVYPHTGKAVLYYESEMLKQRGRVGFNFKHLRSESGMLRFNAKARLVVGNVVNQLIAASDLQTVH